MKFLLNYQCLNWGISLSIKVPVQKINSVFALMEVLHQKSKWFVPLCGSSTYLLLYWCWEICWKSHISQGIKYVPLSITTITREFQEIGWIENILNIYVYLWLKNIQFYLELLDSRIARLSFVIDFDIQFKVNTKINLK